MKLFTYIVLSSLFIMACGARITTTEKYQRVKTVTTSTKLPDWIRNKVWLEQFSFLNNVYSVSQLPDTVTKHPNAITVYVDFDVTEQNKVLIYLINLTESDVYLPAQDGDIYLKLEYQDNDGVWRRGQSHRYFWCGNSYLNPPKLAANTFRILSGYFPSSGDKRVKVRFKSYNLGDNNIFDEEWKILESHLPLISNIGEGWIDKKELNNVEDDAMQITQGSFETVRAIALGKKTLGPGYEHHNSQVKQAIFTLYDRRDFDRDNVIEALNEIIDSIEDDGLKELAKFEIEELEKSAKRFQGTTNRP